MKVRRGYYDRKNSTKGPRPSVHPIYHFIYEEAKRQKMSLAALSHLAGLAHTPLYDAIKGKSATTVKNLEAILNVLGYTISHAPYIEPPPRRMTLT